MSSDHGHEGHEEAHENGPNQEGHKEHAEENHGHKEEEHEKKDAQKHGGKSSSKEEKPRKKLVSEYDLLIILAIAILGRVLLKITPLVNIPSVEPIIPLAVFAGMTYGLGAGALIGLLAYPISNMLIPEVQFDMWSFWQAAGGAIAGALAGYAKKIDMNTLLYFTFVGTVLYEVCVNIPDQMILAWPFSFYHIVSNLFFAWIIGSLAIKD